MLKFQKLIKVKIKKHFKLNKQIIVLIIKKIVNYWTKIKWRKAKPKHYRVDRAEYKNNKERKVFNKKIFHNKKKKQ
jgi:hypothetical protein